MDNCEKCNTELKCEGGCSAHPDNWYCPNCRAQENAKKAENYAASDEGQKAFKKIADTVGKFADKLQRKQNQCQCCFCRHQRRNV